MRELKIFNDYQLELKEMSHRDAVKASTAKYESEIESLEARLQMLQSEKDKDESKHDEVSSNIRLPFCVWMPGVHRITT